MKEAALILFLRVLALLPLRCARALGKALGRVNWWLQTRMARTTQTNLALCFPHKSDAERRALAQASLSHTFQTICEAGAVWLWPAAKTLELVGDVEGLGLLQALGASFVDGQGNELGAGGARLAELARIDLSNLDPRLATVEIEVAADVNNPLCGPHGDRKSTRLNSSHT